METSQRFIFILWMLALLACRPAVILPDSSTKLRIYPSGLIVQRVEDNVTITCEVQYSVDVEMNNSGMIPQLYDLEWNLPPTSAVFHSLRMNVSFGSHNQQTLHIISIQETDSGVYACVAKRSGHILVSNVTVAVVPKKGTCGRGFFVCGRKECIPKRFVCDGRNDCPDGSDEKATMCGNDPCWDKIPCDDGRCLNRKLCCDSAYDELCHIDRVPLCCLHYLKTKLIQRHAAQYDDIGFLQSTIYVIIGCTVAFVFVVIITVMAVCKLHMKQAAITSMSPRYNRRRHANAMAYLTNLRVHQRSPQHVQDRLLSSYIREMEELQSSGNALIECQFDEIRPNCMVEEIMEDIVEPPAYSEIAEEDSPDCEEPPPPYSNFNVSNSSGDEVSPIDGCSSNNSLLRPGVIINRNEDDR